MSELSEFEIISPHLEGSLNLFVAVSDLGLPDGLEGLVFLAVELISVLLAISPHIEHLSEELVSHEFVAEIVLLEASFDWLESTLMPLFNGNFHTVLTETCDGLNELFEGVVALCVEFAVLEEFVHGLLLARYKHALKKSESDLGDEKFVVMTIMTFHLRLFTSDFSHTVVISAIQRLQFVLKLISLISQSFNYSLNILNLSIILQQLTI